MKERGPGTSSLSGWSAHPWRPDGDRGHPSDLRVAYDTDRSISDRANVVGNLIDTIDISEQNQPVPMAKLVKEPEPVCPSIPERREAEVVLRKI